MRNVAEGRWAVAVPDWLVIGGVITGLTMPFVAVLRIRPESRKLKADGAAALTTSAGAIVAAVEHEMATLRGEVTEQKRINAETARWRRGLERRLRRHAAWDDHVVAMARAAGIDVPTPPVLYDEDEDGEVPHGASA